VAELTQEWLKISEIITVVAVSHYDELALCGSNTTNQSGSIPAALNPNNSSTERLRNQNGIIGASVVSDEYFPGDVFFLQALPCSLNAQAQRLGLIQTRN
jgi:hypothetical protein